MNRHRNCLSAAAIAALALCYNHAAQGGVLYSNLGAGDTYNQSSGLTVDSVHNVAGSFSPTANGALGTIELALGYNVNEPTPQNRFEVALAADNSGTPGAIIEDLGVVTSPIGFTTSNHLLVTVPSSTHPLLTAGTRYWIEATNVPPPPPGQPGTDGAWNFDTTFDASPVVTRASGGPWQPTGTFNVAFRVDSAVPEPATWLILAIGAAGVFVLRNRSGLLISRCRTG